MNKILGVSANDKITIIMPKQLFNLPEILTIRGIKQVTQYYLNIRNATVAITWHVLWAELSPAQSYVEVQTLNTLECDSIWI